MNYYVKQLAIQHAEALIKFHTLKQHVNFLREKHGDIVSHEIKFVSAQARKAHLEVRNIENKLYAACSEYAESN
jgi:hypothetical protein